MKHQAPVPEERTAVVNRLRSAEGHLRAVIGMIETGAPCEQVLQQLDAVQAALSTAGGALRYCEFRSSIEIVRRGPSPEVRAAEMRRLASLYGLKLKHLTTMRTTGKERHLT